MPYARHADSLPVVDHLVENSIDADPQRVETPQSSTKGMACEWIALEQAERILDRVDQRPSQFE